MSQNGGMVTEQRLGKDSMPAEQLHYLGAMSASDQSLSDTLSTPQSVSKQRTRWGQGCIYLLAAPRCADRGGQETKAVGEATSHGSADQGALTAHQPPPSGPQHSQVCCQGQQ